jgi:hypothetical protein
LSIHPCGTSRVLLHVVKSYDMGPSRFTSHPRGRCAAGFLSPLKIHRLGWVLNPHPLPSGQHTNHYTTKATKKLYVTVLKIYLKVTLTIRLWRAQQLSPPFRCCVLLSGTPFSSRRSQSATRTLRPRRDLKRHAPLWLHSEVGLLPLLLS